MAQEQDPQDPQDPSQENQGDQLNIELPEEIAEGTYSNLAIITHSNSEFVLDFVRVMPNTPKSKVKSRVLLTPQHAKRLMNALADNLKKYEELHGPISEPSGGPGGEGVPMNFGGPTAKA